LSRFENKTAERAKARGPFIQAPAGEQRTKQPKGLQKERAKQAQAPAGEQGTKQPKGLQKERAKQAQAPAG
jgi:hypothetical protein